MPYKGDVSNDWKLKRNIDHSLPWSMVFWYFLRNDFHFVSQCVWLDGCYFHNLNPQYIKISINSEIYMYFPVDKGWLGFYVNCTKPQPRQAIPYVTMVTNKTISQAECSASLLPWLPTKQFHRLNPAPVWPPHKLFQTKCLGSYF